MDPISALGAAGSVVGVASFGIHLSQVLYQFTSQAWSAKDSLDSILSGIHATTCALNQVHGILAEECENLEQKGRAVFFSAKAIDDVKSTADKCLLIFWRIEATITNKSGSKLEEELIKRLNTFNQQLTNKKSPDPIPVDRSLISMTTWERLRWPYITSKLDNYTSQLQLLQMNLVLMFSVISLHAHRMRPAQGEVDLRILVEAYDRIRMMAAQPEFSQIAPKFGHRHQEPRRLSTSRTRVQLRIESPSPLANTLSPDNLPWGSRKQHARPMSLPPTKVHHMMTASKPYTNFSLERELGRRPRSASYQSDKESMEVGMSVSRNIDSLTDFDALSIEVCQPASDMLRSLDPTHVDTYQDVDESGKDKNDVRQARTYMSPTIITTRSTDLEASPEGAEKENPPKTKIDPHKSQIFESSDNRPHITPAQSNLQIGFPNGGAAIMRGGLAPDDGLNVNSSVEDHEDGKLGKHKGIIVDDSEHDSGIQVLSGILAEPQPPIIEERSSVSQELRRPRTNSESNQKNPLDRVSPQLPITILSPESVPLKNIIPTTQISSPDAILPTATSSSSTVAINTAGKSPRTSALPSSSKPDVDTSSLTQTGKYGSHTELLKSNDPSPSRFESRNIFSRLKSIFIKTQLVHDAFLSAYIIKAGEAYEVPHPGTWKLKRKEIQSLCYQSSKKDWYKTFAFLNEYDMAALQEVLAKGGGDGVESTSSIVYLKKFKESRFKFWTSDEALFAIIRDSSLEASSWDSQSRMDVEDIGLEPSLDLTRAQQPAIRPPSEIGQPAPRIPLPTNPVAMNSINPIPAQPAQAATSAIRPQPPTFSKPIQSFGQPYATPITRSSTQLPSARVFDPLTHGSSARIQDLTPPKYMNEADCLKQLTTYAVFTIRKCPPFDPDAESNWARAEITEERLSQEVITKQIKKLDDADTHTVAEKKANLERYQQNHVTTLIDKLASEEPDRAFEWLLIQLDCIKKPIKNVNGGRKRFQLGTTTLCVYVSRAPLQSLSPVLLYQNLEKAKELALGPPPPPQDAAYPSRPKTVTMSNPITVGATAPVLASSIEKRKKPRKSYSFDDSDSSSLGGTSTISTTSFTSRGALHRETERNDKYSSRLPLNRRTATTTGSTQQPSRLAVSTRNPRPYTLARKDVNIGRSSAGVDPITAAYEAGMADADGKRRPRRSRPVYYPSVADPPMSNEPYYGSTRLHNPVSYGTESTYLPANLNAAEDYMDRRTRERDQGHHSVPSQPPQTRSILQRDPVPYPSHYDSKPYNPQIYDNVGTPDGDEDGRDMVQRLLLEWTPLDQDDEHVEQQEPKEEPTPASVVEEVASDDSWSAWNIPKRTKARKTAAATDESKEIDKPEGLPSQIRTRKYEEGSPVPRGRSRPSSRSISDTKELSRQATVDDIVDERDNEAGQPSNIVPLTTEQKGKGREEELEGFVVETTFTESRTEKSPIPLLQPQSQSQRQPPWLNPSYAKDLVDKTIPRPSTPNHPPTEPTSNGQDPLIVKETSFPPPRTGAEPRFIPQEPIRSQSWYDSSRNRAYPQAYDTFPDRRGSEYFTRDRYLPARYPDLEENPWREYGRTGQRPETHAIFTGSEYAAPLQTSGLGSDYHAEPYTERLRNPFAPRQRPEPRLSFSKDERSGTLPGRRYVERDYATNPRTRARFVGGGPETALRSGMSGYEDFYGSPPPPAVLPRRYPPDYSDSGW